MARRLRIEFPEAIYHVLNRGNYRGEVFHSAGEASAFVRTLEEAARIYAWRIYAYAVMPNHYHIALQTPQPNLKDGMHWLQSTFATRFNRFHRERGHVFQGRYQSLLVQDQAALARLVNYIHLNPVRAGLVRPEQPAVFRWSSLTRFVRGGRFPGLEAEHWLHAMELTDDAEGWNVYLQHLCQLAGDAAEQDRLGFGKMSRGWAIGTDGWRRAVATEQAHMAIDPGLAAADARELREARCADALKRLVREIGHTEEHLHREAKSAPWKIALAARLREETGAPIAWIASALHMGSPNSVRVYLSRFSKVPHDSPRLD